MTRFALSRQPSFLARLAALGVVAFVLCWELERHSFWIDELATWDMTEGSLADVVDSSVRDIHPPLYYVALKLWIDLVGKSDFTLRLFSALIGVAAAALAGPVARRFVGERAALPATLLLGLHPAFVELSRMARYYSLLVLLSLVSLLALERALSNNRRRDWALYALSVVFTVHTFYPSVFLVGAHVPIVLWRSRARFRELGLSLVAAALVSLPWFLVVSHAQAARVMQFSGAELSGSLLGLSMALLASAYTFAVGQTLYPWSPEAWLAAAAVAWLVWLAVRNDDEVAGRALFAAFGLAVVSMSLLVVYFARSTPFLYAPVRGLFALPFFSLTLALAVTRVNSNRRLVACTLALAAGWGSAHRSYFGAREYLNPIHYTPGKDAALRILANADPTDVVIAEPDIGIGHYLRAERSALRLRSPGDEGVLEDRPPRVWLVRLGRDRTRLSYGASSRSLIDELERDYERIDVWRLRPIEPTYAYIKEKLLGRTSYSHRLVLELHRRDPR